MIRLAMIMLFFIVLAVVIRGLIQANILTMKNAPTTLISIISIALLAAGIYFIHTCVQDYPQLPVETRKFALIGGITCVVLAVGMALFAVVFAKKNE